jgi:outer membrane protein assembly factor BamB
LAGLALAVLVLSACGAGPGDSWAGISAGADTDTIYVSFNKHLVAINPVSGATLWDYSDPDDAKFYAVPVIDDGTIYVGDYAGKLHAVSAEGEAIWVYKPERDTLIGPLSATPTDRVISGVAVDSNKVFFGLGSRNVVAVSRETAEQVWTFKTDHGVWATPLYIPANDENSRATLYVVSLDHYLYALDPETGDLIWKKHLGGAAPGGLVYDKDRNRAYIGTFVSELLALDLTTHEIIATYDTEDWIWGAPAFEPEDSMLYVGDLGGNLYAVRITENGFEPVWNRSVAEDAIRATPLLTDGRVIVGSQDKYVYALSKEDGTAVWSEKTRGEVLTELVFVPGGEASPDLVVVGTTEKDRLLMAYDVDSGDEVWHYSDDD